MKTKPLIHLAQQPLLRIPRMIKLAILSRSAENNSKKEKTNSQRSKSSFNSSQNSSSRRSQADVSIINTPENTTQIDPDTVPDIGYNCKDMMDRTKKNVFPKRT